MVAESDFALHPIGKLYGQWAFNFLVDIASAIADDSIERPQHYAKTPEEAIRILSGFRSLLGSHPDWPDSQQRTALFRMLGAMCGAGAGLREAALVYAEAGTEVNRDLLMNAVRNAAASLRNQIKTLEGQSLEIGCRQIDAAFNNAVRLFQSEAVMRVFDLAPAPNDENWPIVNNLTGEGSNLATELIRALDAGNVARALLGGPKREIGGAPAPKFLRISMPQNKFILLQQAAAHGALTISHVMAKDGLQGDLQPLIAHAYQWTKALQRLVPDVVRVWKDPNYRIRLTDLEWGMVEPHPSGDMELALGGGGFGAGFSTATVRGEVCCCTGDLPCPSSSNCEVSPGPSCINCGSIALVQCAAGQPAV